ncbi:MAG: hypothetical protein LBH00_04640 [Planctomycetaceae bacterium]|jgi:hypothetical protein|nr:hypothetical protein [Planctomycetaceae bacterium]
MFVSQRACCGTSYNIDMDERAEPASGCFKNVSIFNRYFIAIELDMRQSRHFVTRSIAIIVEVDKDFAQFFTLGTTL